MSENNLSAAIIKWGLGLLGAVITAALIHQVIRYMDQNEKMKTEGIFVQLVISSSDKRELDKNIDSVLSVKKKIGFDIADGKEIQLSILREWAIHRVLLDNNPGKTNILTIPTDYILSKGVKEFRLTTSHELIGSNGAKCIKVQILYITVNGGSHVESVPYCLIRGYWKAQLDKDSTAWEFSESSSSCKFTRNVSSGKDVKLMFEASTFATTNGMRFGIFFYNSSMFSGRFFEVRDLQVFLVVDGVRTKLHWASGIPDENGFLALTHFDYFWDLSGTKADYLSRIKTLKNAKTISVQINYKNIKFKSDDISVSSLKDRIKRSECQDADISEILDNFID